MAKVIDRNMQRDGINRTCQGECVVLCCVVCGFVLLVIGLHNGKILPK